MMIRLLKYGQQLNLYFWKCTHTLHPLFRFRELK